MALLAGVLLLPLAAGASGAGRQWIALVTAESNNQVIAVALPSGHVVKRIQVAADPENVAGLGNRAVVVSTRGRAVTILDAGGHVVRVLHGFTAPHIARITPDGEYAYVTDDGSGKLNVIRLARPRIVRRVFVGLGAHHFAISPDENRAWVALGEQAHRIVILDTSRVSRPKVIGRLKPRGEAHDLAFTPSGARVWVTHANSNLVSVYDARTRRLLKTVVGGRPPQHVAFVPGVHGRLLARAYITSGYGRTIQLRNARTAFLYGPFPLDYGSFNLGKGGGYVATASLFRGTMTLFSQNLTRLGHWHLARATRDVAIVLR